MHTRRKHWSKFFTFAAGKGWIDANPLTDIKLPKKKPTDDRAPKVQQDFIRWLQTDGLDAYSAAYAKAAELVLADGRKGYKKRNELTISPKKLAIMMFLSMTTGLRQGELRALRRCDYSSNRQKITTRLAISHGTQDLGDVKTDTGQDREIEVPSEVCALLDAWLAESKFQAFDDLVFPSTVGTPLRKNDFSQACKPIRAACPFVDEKTGNPLHFLWGDLRHAFASVMIDQLGANWAEVAESMGHTNANFTRKQYGHYIVDDEKSARKRLAAANILVERKGRL
jgi:integrase